MARSSVLDETKRREIVAILSVGCSRRTAASYVGCSVATIGRTARRDPAFAQQLRRAEKRPEIGHAKSIERAAGKEQYWRAAAWALERMNPEDFAARKPEMLTLDQLAGFLTELTEILTQEVPVARYRKNVLRRVEALIAAASASQEPETSDDDAP